MIVPRLGQRSGGAAAEAQDETIDLLFALTGFPMFDLLAGPQRTPADVAPIVLRVARAVLGLAAR